MFKISFKIVLLFISVSLMRLSLEYLIGSSKPYYCISACDSSFERGLHAFMPFVVGSFILWLTIRDFDRGDQLIQTYNLFLSIILRFFQKLHFGFKCG